MFIYFSETSMSRLGLMFAAWHSTGVWVLQKDKVETKLMIWFGYFKPLEKCHKGPHWKACWNKWENSASHQQIWAHPSHLLVASETALDPNFKTWHFRTHCSVSPVTCVDLFPVGHMRSGIKLLSLSIPVNYWYLKCWCFRLWLQ